MQRTIAGGFALAQNDNIRQLTNARHFAEFAVLLGVRRRLAAR